MQPYHGFFHKGFLSSLDGKKIKELWAVYHFLLNEGVVPANPNEFNVNPAEPTDIAYLNRNFQVTTGSQDQDAVINLLTKHDSVQKGNVIGSWIDLGNGMRAKASETTSSIYDGVDNDILRPLRNKIERYGEYGMAVKDVTLLIFSFGLPVTDYEEEFWQKFLVANRALFNSSGFRKIYWCDQKKNILLHENVAKVGSNR
jgi:hypothetical protein